MVLLLAAAAIAQTLTASGPCPGVITIDATDMTPGGAVSVMWGAAGLDDDLVAYPPCIGVETDLGGIRYAVRTRDEDRDGRLRFRPTVGPLLCGAPVQVLDESTCTLTNVITLGALTPDGGSSCKAIKEAYPAAESGVYTLTPDDGGSFDAYCEMTIDGGGWTVMAYLRDPSHWDWGLFEDHGIVGDTDGGFASGATLDEHDELYTEKLIAYLSLIELGVDQGTQWMVNDRPDAQRYSSINGSSGWNYYDSYGYDEDGVSSVCTHGCSTYRGFGMFNESGGAHGYCGTQGGDYGCRDGNNICWVPRSLGCNVGGDRCAYLTGVGEGVIYAVR